MSDSLRIINISDIDLKNEHYKITYGAEDIGFLARSIKEIGLITPPVVVRPMKGIDFIIISGFNRIRAFSYNTEARILVYELDGDTDEFHCLLKAIASIAFKRPLTQVETIMSIKRLSKFLEIEEIAQKSPIIFNRQLNENFIRDLLNIGLLPAKSLELIHTGNLSLQSAKKLAYIDKSDIGFFLDIFSTIKATASVQLEIIQNVLEISAREGAQPSLIFDTMKIDNSINNSPNDIIEKTHQFRTMVFDRRYPILSRTHRIIKDKIASLKLPGTLKLIPPENFESRNYSVSFKIKNFDEFRKNTDYLTDSLENKALQEILNS